VQSGHAGVRANYDPVSNLCWLFADFGNGPRSSRIQGKEPGIVSGEHWTTERWSHRKSAQGGHLEEALMNPPINRENLRDALIAVAICGLLAFAFNDCATVPPPKQQQAAMAAPGYSATLMVQP
jgi:hypothetical protein